MAVKWFYKMAGQEIGPFTSQQLKQLADEKRITPADPVRRDIDTEWSVAGNVKGLFVEKADLPTGVAVPVPPKTPPTVTPVAAPVEPVVSIPPVATPVKPKAGTGVHSVRPSHGNASRTPQNDSGSGEFAFDFDPSASSRASGSRIGSASRVGSKASFKSSSRHSGGKNSAAGSASAEDGADGEKKTLSKKEIQKRNFLIIVAATIGVILLAAVILIIASCKGGSKPEGAEGEAAAVENGTETSTDAADKEKDAGSADTSKDAKGSKDSKDSADSESDDSTEEAKAVSDAEKDGVPKELAEAGYKPAYVDGKIMSCTFGTIQITVTEIKNQRIGDFDPNTPLKDKEKMFCFMTIKVKNVSKDEVLNVPSWGKSGRAALRDKKNDYKVQSKALVEGQIDPSQLLPNETVTDVLIFNRFIDTVDYLCLTLPPIDRDAGEMKIYIPKELYGPKKKDVKDADSAEDGENAENAENAEISGDAEGAEGADGTKDAKDAAGAADATAEKPAESTDDAKTESAAPSSEAEPAAEQGGLVDELGKTPPPPDAETKQLKSAEESLDIFNDPNLE